MIPKVGRKPWGGGGGRNCKTSCLFNNSLFHAVEGIIRIWIRALKLTATRRELSVWELVSSADTYSRPDVGVYSVPVHVIIALNCRRMVRQKMLWDRANSRNYEVFIILSTLFHTIIFYISRNLYPYIIQYLLLYLNYRICAKCNATGLDVGALTLSLYELRQHTFRNDSLKTIVMN